ncbi:DUF4913 domain-containing protein [Nocardia nova]|uniref:DUF4913 domain-containing protein n=1 Tax=Nocardia nova TaxID=37330 RepID=UPI003717B4FE
MTTTTPTHGAGPADAAAAGGATAAAGSAATQIIAPAELSELMDAVVRKAVSAKFAEQAKEIAAKVVEDLLTDEIREQMAETAAHEAELALNPPVAVEPEPEPEPVAAAEEQPKLKYPDVETFVEKHVAHLYRREVSMQGTENKIRWCRDWYLHGEVWARFEALWMAFEHLRQGPGPEQSAYWLNHFSPMMREIFDPEGPFKYCTVSGGHHDKLVPLPFNPAPRANPDQARQPSGIVVPTAPTVHHQRIIRTDFP